MCQSSDVSGNVSYTVGIPVTSGKKYRVHAVAKKDDEKVLFGTSDLLDFTEIAETVKNSDTLVFVTPIYYYEMSGQMKTLLDRMNPLYSSDYGFRRVYMLSTAAEDEEATPEKAVSGLQGWVDCFEKAELAGTLFCGGINDPGEANARAEELDEAYAFGRGIK